MSAPYTPGPWERHDTPDYAEIHPASGKQRSAIALVGKPEDARLIAKAPELVEALEKALPFIGSAACRSQIICGVDAGELYCVIEALLAEVRGDA